MRNNIEENGQMFFWRSLPTVRREKESVSLLNIFPDDKGQFALGIHTVAAASGDIWLTMQQEFSPEDDFVYLPTIRLRSGIGGGNNPFITEGFGSILSYFANGMRESFEEETKPRKGERLNSNSQVEVNRNQAASRLDVIGIQDDDGNPSFLDISVLKTGDVKLRVRHRESGEKEARGEMLFKTREHGGKNPFIAARLTQLAEEIAAAAKRRSR
jgi:hypothetical protein